IHGMGEEAALAKLHTAPVDGIFGSALETRLVHHEDVIVRDNFNGAGEPSDRIFSFGGRNGG
ncbi:MAG TPA: hypothetical protein VJ724_11560, partial [Tahibacter sp.]|nr:hypothetical protein [Tahibacter sp.]